MDHGVQAGGGRLPQHDAGRAHVGAGHLLAGPGQRREPLGRPQSGGDEAGDAPGERPGDAARFLISYMPAIAVSVAVVLSMFVRFQRPAISEVALVPGPEQAGAGPSEQAVEEPATPGTGTDPNNR